MSNRNVRDDVNAELAFDPFIDSADIRMKVDQHGRVVLSGSVASWAQSVEAAAAVWRVGQVTEVVNDLRVDRPSHAVSDAELGNRAERALSWTAAVPDAVATDVLDGTVRLTGAVDWPYQRDAAYSAVRDLDGVGMVQNDIVVLPVLDGLDFGPALREALTRIALLDDDSVVEVSSLGSTVYLDGQVRTWAERDAVDDAAWRASGVAEVQDRLRVLG